MGAVSKSGKGGSGMGPVAGSLLTLGQRVLLGGLCGVGAVWAVTALWSPSKALVWNFSHQVSKFSIHYPVALLGLTVGVLGSLLWSAVKK